MLETTADRLLNGRMSLKQPSRGHRAGTDALLLADAARPLAKGAVADFGAGAGAAGIALAVLEPAITALTLVEIDPALSALSTQNLSLNALTGSRAVCCDISASIAERERADLPRGAFGMVIMNPPFRSGARSRASPDASRALAHIMPDADLAGWVKAASHHLKAKGYLCVIHRADAVGVLLDALGKGFGAIRLRFVHPRADAPALRLLLTAQKGSRAPLQILPPLILHEADGAFTPEAAAIHNGTAALPDKLTGGRPFAP